ncbi:MAG: hypothetical protein Q8R32_01665 [bacterium]|nr:hypothetical protein [bacterium]
MRDVLRIPDPREAEAIARLATRDDFESRRIRRLLALPDLTRKPGSPVQMIVDAVVTLPRFQDFEVLEVPRVVSVEDNFNLLNTPPDHPSRQNTDTYYLDEQMVLRTHTTVMWSYHLRTPGVREKLLGGQSIGALCFGSVYRKDEIDRTHSPVFHQIDGWYLQPRSQGDVTVEDLKEVLGDIVRALYGSEVRWKTVPDQFPFTEPSLEVQVEVEGRTLEVLGSGLVHPSVLRNLGLDPAAVSGWAFGFGVDRLAMLKMRIPDIRILWSDDPRITSQFTSLDSIYRPVSRYPSIIRDISFVVSKEVSLNEYYEVVRDLGGDLVQEVKLLDRFENAEKFGADKVSYTFRVVYQSFERTLTSAEVDALHRSLEEQTRNRFSAVIR